MTKSGVHEADALKALAHPVRLQILDILARGEACVCHMVTVLKQRQPYISQHLMVLRQAGYVLDRRDGTIVYYRLANPQVLALVEGARAFARARGDALTVLQVPDSPVPGCPCPKCGGGPC
ncbi:MAG: helix-turn-helix transcriptional regulator [Chloroflexi bacterium]|nr:helix-turn-helix transcriptional regulator [Chloroflexota bacterium]